MECSSWAVTLARNTLSDEAFDSSVSVYCTGQMHFTRAVHLAVPRAQVADSESDDLRRPAQQSAMPLDDDRPCLLFRVDKWIRVE
jgi:hypothetical protein